MRRLWRWCRRRIAAGVGLDGPSEHAIDELGRGLAAEELGKLNRLVNSGPERHCSIAVQGFIESDPQHVAVDGRHLSQRPQRCPLLYDPIDRCAVGQYSLNQL